MSRLRKSDDLAGVAFAGVAWRGVCRPGVASLGALGIPAVGFDPDALARIAQIETAKGSPMSTLQRLSINSFIKAEKAAARWDSHKRLYLPIWQNAAANAICLRTGTTGTWVNSPTQGAGFVQGNGTTQYFDTGASPSALGATNANASIWKLVVFPDSRNDGRYSGWRGPSTERFIIGQGGNASINASIGGTTSPGNVTVTDRSGVVISSNESISSRFLAARRASGWTLLSPQSTTETTPLVDLNIFFMAWNANNTGGGGFSDEMLGGYGFSLGLPQTAASAFAENVKVLWETCTGMVLTDPDALAYVAAVAAAKGSAVTATQSLAINTFVLAEKDSGRWNLHKRVYFPIWANAAANAICLRTLTTGSWVNAPTMAAGYVQGNGSTSYFNSGSSPTALGLTNSSATLWKLVALASPSNSARYTGSRGSGSERFHNGQSSLTSANCAIGGGASPGSYNDSERNGIIIASNEQIASRFVGARRSSGWSILISQTTTEITPLLDMPVFFFARNYVGSPDSFSDERMGSYGFSTGMSQSQAMGFTAALETLWKTCTGLTFPPSP